MNGRGCETRKQRKKTQKWVAGVRHERENEGSCQSSREKGKMIVVIKRRAEMIVVIKQGGQK